MLYDENTADSKTLIKIAAKKVFLKKGFAGTRLQEIANEAGIGRTALHYYFSSKENLFAEVLKDFFGEVGTRMPEIGSKDLSAKELMKLFVNDYIDTAIKSPEIDLFMLNECNENPDVFKEIKQSMPDDLPSFLMEAITKAVANGNLIGDPRQILLTFMSVCMFPFAGMAMVKSFIGLSDSEFNSLMSERKAYLEGFIDTMFKA
ncbi:TetR/AcrR family transcriptional regulator [Sphingobacterium sp. LRF_L2]|uniref:TetR/AcrR family transcriptional regulator n=1 Tax=Sphingobacterium sp. LRF_L2 TaxID=3369421 RepID=UPI003F62AA72